MRELNDILAAATEAIHADYFLLPIDGGPAVSRERVYCYELYHQLRLRWPEGCDYSLGGEVDKRNHPILKDLEADRCIPDLLVHTPGDMRGNAAIIEVKVSKGLKAKHIRKDIRTLSRFVVDVRYQRAIYLIYGHTADNRLLNRIERIAVSECRCLIELWTHIEAESEARHQRTIIPQVLNEAVIP
ncbi:MAG: hypothetical protein KF688_10310 [Pirellulales bacterium]|nr:hypothetical protein [Pirellulales bacterium]